MSEQYSFAIKIFSLPRSSAWELGHQSERGSDCDMDSEMYQYSFATEFVDMFP